MIECPGPHVQGLVDGLKQLRGIVFGNNQIKYISIHAHTHMLARAHTHVHTFNVYLGHAQLSRIFTVRRSRNAKAVQTVIPWLAGPMN